MNDQPLYFARADSEFEALRKDKKYAEILKRMGFRDEHEHPLHLCEDFVDMEERLAKLEAVCQEIAESGEILDAQKVKAILEEA